MDREALKLIHEILGSPTSMELTLWYWLAFKLYFFAINSEYIIRTYGTNRTDRASKILDIYTRISTPLLGVSVFMDIMKVIKL